MCDTREAPPANADFTEFMAVCAELHETDPQALLALIAVIRRVSRREITIEEAQGEFLLSLNARAVAPVTTDGSSANV